MSWHGSRQNKHGGGYGMAAMAVAGMVRVRDGGVPGMIVGKTFVTSSHQQAINRREASGQHGRST